MAASKLGTVKCRKKFAVNEMFIECSPFVPWKCPDCTPVYRLIMHRVHSKSSYPKYHMIACWEFLHSYNFHEQTFLVFHLGLEMLFRPCEWRLIGKLANLLRPMAVFKENSKLHGCLQAWYS